MKGTGKYDDAGTIKSLWDNCIIGAYVATPAELKSKDHPNFAGTFIHKDIGLKVYKDTGKYGRDSHVAATMAYLPVHSYPDAGFILTDVAATTAYD